MPAASSEQWDQARDKLLTVGVEKRVADELIKSQRECGGEPGFVMAELEGPPVPPRPSNLRWAMEWNIEIILRSRL